MADAARQYIPLTGQKPPETKPFKPGLQGRFVRYGLAVGVALCGLLIRLPFAPVLGEKVPYMTFFLATAVSAGFGGFGPGLVTTLVGGFLAAHYIVPRAGSVIFSDPFDYLGLAMFVLVSGIISYVCGALIRSREHAAEAQVAEAAQRELFQQTLLCIGDGVVSTTIDKRVRLMNPVAEELTGWLEAEAKDQPVETVLSLATEETGETAQSPIDKALTGTVTGLASHTELIRRDGTRIPIADNGAPIRDPSGSVVGAVIVFRDVSDARSAERAIAEAEGRSRAILESISDAFAALDPHWRFTYINAAAEQILGNSREQILGHSHWELYPATRGTPLEEAYRHAMDARMPAAFENYYEPWDRWFSVRVYPATDGGLAVYFIDITERKRAEHATERLAAIVESSDDAILGKTLEGVITSWNRGAERIFGYTAAEATGQYIHLIIPEDKRAEEDEVLARLRRGERIDHYETERVTKHGGRINISLTVSPIRNSAGQIIGAAKVARDITERKKRELRDAFLVRLDDATRPVTDAFELTQTAAHLLGEQLGVNRCAYADIDEDEETFNLTGNYTNGVRSMVGRYKLQDFGTEFARLTRAGVPCVVENAQDDPRVADVLDFYENTNIVAVISVSLKKAGRLVAGMAVHQAQPRHWRPDEIELVQLVANRCWESIERARVERELRSSEEQFRTLANAIPNLVWMAHSDGHIFWYNRRWYEYTGTTPEEMEGWGWQRVHDPQVLAEVLQRWKNSLVTGEPFEMVFPLKRADGVFRPFLTRVEPVRDGQGWVYRWFGTNTDISAQREVEDALRKSNAALQLANRELEEFAYVASHDLQEPLRMVNIYTELLLQRSVHDDKEVEEYGKIISHGVTRMDELIRDLLSYSRVIHDDGLHPESADLSESLSRALETLRSRIEETGAVVTAGPLPVVRGEIAQLASVFQNLLSNSLKYRNTDIGPEIDISAHRDNDRWIIVVRDNGIGFDQTYAERIFGLFKRLHKDEYPGTGLGLAICQRIVERYDGRMWAEGYPGKGATFYFALPAADEHASHSPG